MACVELNGRRFQEMHVDGGAAAQMFLYPPSIGLRPDALQTTLARERHAYLIGNSRLGPGMGRDRPAALLDHGCNLRFRGV
jgi:hypothetical protein